LTFILIIDTAKLRRHEKYVNTQNPKSLGKKGKMIWEKRNTKLG